MIGGLIAIVVLALGGQWVLWTAAKRAGVIPPDSVLTHGAARRALFAESPSRSFTVARATSVVALALAVFVLFGTFGSERAMASQPLIPAYTITFAGLGATVFWAFAVARRRPKLGSPRQPAFTWSLVGLVGSVAVTLIGGALMLAGS